MHLSYLDFELEIGIGQGRDFPVVARSPAGEARAIMHFPFDELALESRLKDLQIALLRSGGKRRQTLLPKQQAVRDFGQALFDSLFIGEVRNRYDVSLQQARSEGKGLRIRLQAQSPTAAALPWEYLYDPRQSEYCALSVETPLVRFLELPQPISPLAVTSPLRMLGMVASPADLPGLDIDQEKQRIAQALKGPLIKGRLELEWLPGQTWRDLHEALRRGPWHIFHFSGHGRFDVLTDEGQLIFADDLGRAHVMPASDVGRLLANHRAMRLAWLNACEGARGGEADIFSSAASILVRRGIPAVVAMQHEITDRAAIELARTFYGALADGYPVDAALAEARVATSLAVNNTVEWGTPVLYMRAPDGVLFDMASPAKTGQAPIETAIPVEIAANPALSSLQPAHGEAAPGKAPDQPALQPTLTTAAKEPVQRSPRRALLPIAVVGIAIAAIILIASMAGLFPETAQVRETKTVLALIETVTRTPPLVNSTVTPTTSAVAALAVLMPTPTHTHTPTAKATPTHTPASKTTPPRTSTPTTLPIDVVFTDQNATVIGPIRLQLVGVPAGEFLMGSDRAEDLAASGDELPQHRVSLTEFYIGKYEVTNAQYAVFVEATGHRAPDDWENGSVPADKYNHPVVYVSWYDVLAFTDWLSKETDRTFRLPTEAEWEKACRGTSDLVYPWGNEFAVSEANTTESGIGTTTSVGSYSPDGDSPYFVADMTGNVNEWTSSLYYDYPYDSSDGRENMSDFSEGRVLRGGSYFNSASSVRCAARVRLNPLSPNDRGIDLGFRIALTPP